MEAQLVIEEGPYTLRKVCVEGPVPSFWSDEKKEYA
jgi:hypothetical protein